MRAARAARVGTPRISPAAAQTTWHGRASEAATGPYVDLNWSVACLFSCFEVVNRISFTQSRFSISVLAGSSDGHRHSAHSHTAVTPPAGADARGPTPVASVSSSAPTPFTARPSPSHTRHARTPRRPTASAERAARTAHTTVYRTHRRPPAPRAGTLPTTNTPRALPASPPLPCRPGTQTDSTPQHTFNLNLTVSHPRSSSRQLSHDWHLSPHDGGGAGGARRVDT